MKNNETSAQDRQNGKKGPFGALAKGAMTAAIVMFAGALSGCGNAAGPQHQQPPPYIPGPGNGGNNGSGQQPVATPLINLEFPAIVGGQPSAQSEEQLGAAMLQLYKQSQDITERFEQWAATGNLDAQQLQFAELFMFRQRGLRHHIRFASEIHPIAYTIGPALAVSVQEGVFNGYLRHEVENQTLFENINATRRAAIALNKSGNMAPHRLSAATASFNVARQSILTAGGPQIPTNPQEALVVLTDLLESMLPERLGPYRNDTIQQLEDAQQFRSFTDDMTSIGHGGVRVPMPEFFPTPTTRQAQAEAVGICH